MRWVLTARVAFLGLLSFTYLFGLPGVAAALTFNIALWHGVLLSLLETYSSRACL
jgi:hypothetical protein